MQPATSMSRFANCAPRKKKGVVTSTTADSSACGTVVHRRRKKNSEAAAAPPPRTDGSRAAHSTGPDHRHRGGADPVEQRRLVEEGQAVEPRHQPVAGVQHRERDAAIAALVGRHQRTEPGGGQPATRRARQ